MTEAREAVNALLKALADIREVTALMDAMAVDETFKLAVACTGACLSALAGHAASRRWPEPVTRPDPADFVYDGKRPMPRPEPVPEAWEWAGATEASREAHPRMPVEEDTCGDPNCYTCGATQREHVQEQMVGSPPCNGDGFGNFNKPGCKCGPCTQRRYLLSPMAESPG